VLSARKSVGGIDCKDVVTFQIYGAWCGCETGGTRIFDAKSL